MKRILLSILMAVALVGCTRTSTKLAIQGSERSDTLRTSVVDNQHNNLKALLFYRTVAEVERAGTPEARLAALQLTFSDRDKLELLYVQDTLARALHLATVDAKLTDSQGLLGVLLRTEARRWQEPIQTVDDLLNQPGPTTRPVE